MMADFTEDDGAPQTTNMHPVLQNFIDQFDTGSGNRDWATNSAIQLDDYLKQRELAANNQATGHAFINHMNTFRRGLTQLVSNDPTSVQTAMNLVSPTIANVISQQPDGVQDAVNVHKQLTAELQNQLALTAVQKMAEHDRGGAERLLQDPAVSAALSPEDTRGLNNYIGMQAIGRGVDNAAAQRQNNITTMQEQATAALSHLAAMDTSRDDAGQNFRPIPGWGQGLMADGSLATHHRAGLMNTYTRLIGSPQPAYSNPSVVMDVMRPVAEGAGDNSLPGAINKLIDMVGQGGLRLSDAVWMGKMMMSPDGRQQLSQVYNTARQSWDRLQGRDRENGVAGFMATMRFVAGLMASARRGAMPEGELLQQYQQAGLPTGADLYKAMQSYTRGTQRKELAEIFGGKIR